MKIKVNLAGAVYWTVGMAVVVLAGIVAIQLLFLRYSWENADRAYQTIENYPKYFSVRL